jgi:hypothetical protein
MLAAYIGGPQEWPPQWLHHGRRYEETPPFDCKAAFTSVAPMKIHKQAQAVDDKPVTK